MAEIRAEAQGVITSLERALAEEREQGKQRLHRRAPAPTRTLTPTPTPTLPLTRLRLELTGSASEQLAAQQAR